MNEIPARDPFIRKAAIAAAVVALAALLAALLILGIKVLLASFGGVLFGVLLNTLARKVEHRSPLSYRPALAAVVLALAVVLGATGWALAPNVVQQVEEVGADLPALLQSVEARLERYAWGRQIVEDARSGRLPGTRGVDAEAIVGALSGGSTYLLLTVLVGLFGAANPRLYRQGIINLFPLPHRGRIRIMVDELVQTLRWWLIGQAIAMVLIGVSTGVMLWLFGLPFALLLGLIVGLLGFVPFLGPIVSVLPVALVAATGGAAMLLWVTVAYTVIQMLEGYVATPLIQHRTVYLPPVFTIVSQILLGAVVGVLGIVMATPLAAVVLVLSRYYRTDILGDRDAARGRRRR